MKTKQNDKKYIADTYARFDLEIVGGEGALLYGADGKSYIDMGTGIAVNTFGIDKEWIGAVKAQLDSGLTHTSNLYYSSPMATLAELLCKKTGAKKVFFGNSGAEANECAIKVARKWGLDNKGEGNTTIVTLKNSFHGRTVTTLAATGQDVFHTDFGPFTEGFVYATPDDAAELYELTEKNACCAIMIELVQGEGGVYPLSREYVDAIVKICKEKDLLLIVDEVQTGNGRSGSLYAFMEYGIAPDVVTTAKGLGGGLPIGACMMFEKTEKVLTPGSHGSTFGGNPIAAAGAVNIISRLNAKALKGVKMRSEYIKNELMGSKGVRSVSGLGLMLGIETVADAGLVIKECMQRGVLPLKAKNKVRLLPALNIPMPLLKKAIKVIKEVTEELSNES